MVLDLITKCFFLLSLPGPDKELLHVVQKYRFENLVMFLSPLNKGGSPGTIRECRNKGGMRGTQHTDLAQILRPSFFLYDAKEMEEETEVYSPSHHI